MDPIAEENNGIGMAALSLLMLISLGLIYDQKRAAVW